MHGIVTQLTRCSLLVAATAALVLGSPETLSAQTRQQPATATPEYEHFLAKVNVGRPVTVAFLGGSVTVGATTRPRLDPNGNYDFTGYVRERDCWRAQFMRDLRNAIAIRPRQIKMVNAGLSGLGSLPGAFRYSSDVGVHNPDMLIVEFAINEAAVAELSVTPGADFSIQRSLLSIVEQARAQNPNVAILMVLSPTRTITTDLDSRAAKVRVITRDSSIAFGVPFADVSTDFYERPLPAGVSLEDLYSGDLTRMANGLHPSPIGHTVYARSVMRTVKRILLTNGFAFPQQQNPVPTSLLPFPATPRLVTPEMMPSSPGFGQSTNLENWRIHPVFAGKPAMFVTKRGSEIQLDFRGSSAAVLWEWNFEGQQINGRFQALLDGEDLGIFSTEPNLSLGEQRLPRFQVLGEGLDPMVPHTILIRVPRQQLGSAQENLNLALMNLFVERN